jgi:hypothetical protein
MGPTIGPGTDNRGRAGAKFSLGHWWEKPDGAGIVARGADMSGPVVTRPWHGGDGHDAIVPHDDDKEADMSIYYHKQITLIPRLLHLSISSHGWAVRFGTRRAQVTRHSGGGHSASVRLPGGFSWRRSSRRH